MLKQVGRGALRGVVSGAVLLVCSAFIAGPVLGEEPAPKRAKTIQPSENAKPLRARPPAAKQGEKGTAKAPGALEIGPPTRLPERPGVTYAELHQRVQGYLAADKITLNEATDRRRGHYEPFEFNHYEHLEFAEEGCGFCHHKAEPGEAPRTCDSSGCHDLGGSLESKPRTRWAHNEEVTRTPGTGVGCVGCHDDLGADTGCRSCHKKR